MQTAVAVNSAVNMDMKIERAESDQQEQEMVEEEEEEVSDEDGELRSTQKPSGSLFTITKSTEQVLTIGDVYKDTDKR